jgi:hypothetical protein
MLPRHWIMLVVVLLVGYAAGIAFPNFGKAAVSKVSGVVS